MVIISLLARACRRVGGAATNRCGKCSLVGGKQGYLAGNIYTKKMEHIEVHWYGVHISNANDDDVVVCLMVHASEGRSTTWYFWTATFMGALLVNRHSAKAFQTAHIWNATWSLALRLFAPRLRR
jgi:hypothetical protein